MCSLNVSNHNITNRNNIINDWGTGRPPKKSIECFGDINKPPAFYLYKCALDQPYNVTSLTLSKNRPHDSLVPDANHINNKYYNQINCEIPVYHPYSSHIPYFETIPKYNKNKNISDYLSEKQHLPKWIINSKISGNPHRVETFTKNRDDFKRKAFNWKPFMMSSKFVNERDNNYYPSPKTLIQPVDESIFILPDEKERNKRLLHLSKSNFISTYQADFSQIDHKSNVFQENVVTPQSLTSQIFDFEVDQQDKSKFNQFDIPFNSALFSHFYK